MCSSRAPRSVCAAPTWASTLRMRSVAAIANTPSANVSNRLVVMPAMARGRIELPTRGFSVLPAVFSVPEHRPTSDIRCYYIHTSAAALGGRCVGSRRICLMVRGTTGGQSSSAALASHKELRSLPAFFVLPAPSSLVQNRQEGTGELDLQIENVVVL